MYKKEGLAIVGGTEEEKKETLCVFIFYKMAEILTLLEQTVTTLNAYGCDKKRRLNSCCEVVDIKRFPICMSWKCLSCFLKIPVLPL